MNAPKPVTTAEPRWQSLFNGKDTKGWWWDRRGSFSVKDGDWRAYVVGTCHLSDTIEIAIWDLWIRNQEIAERDGWTYHPWHYAQDFLENYTADGSRTDVWEGDALELARARVAKYRAAEE